MMKTKLISTLEKQANWKSIFILFALLVFFNLVLFPGILSSGTHNLVTHDQLFWYTPQRAYEIMDAYPPEFLRFAVIGYFMVDMIYPLLYGSIIWFLLIITFQRAYSKNSFADRVVFFPWAGVICDYLENISLSIIYLQYPKELTAIAWMATTFTALKWIFIGIGLLLVCIGAVKLVLTLGLRPQT